MCLETWKQIANTNYIYYLGLDCRPCTEKWVENKSKWAFLFIMLVNWVPNAQQGFAFIWYHWTQGCCLPCVAELRTQLSWDIQSELVSILKKLKGGLVKMIIIILTLNLNSSGPCKKHPLFREFSKWKALHLVPA